VTGKAVVERMAAAGFLFGDAQRHSRMASNMNPNTYILAANNTWEWLARASGPHIPKEIMASVNVEHRSGRKRERRRSRAATLSRR
jgi:hypothetical protein